MVYGRNGQHITIKKGESSLGKPLEKRLNPRGPVSSVSNKDRPSEKTNKKTVLADFNFFSKLRVLPAVIVVAFAVMFLRVPNFFEQSEGGWRASKVLGPVSAPISKIRKKYRCRILIKYPKDLFIQKYLSEMLNTIKLTSGIKLEVDVDPINFS